MLSEEFAQDFKRIYIHGGFAVEFDIAEDFLRYFISHLSGQRNEHGFGERTLDESFNDGEVLACERLETLCLWTESEGYGQLEQESDMEIAEIAFYRVQQLYAFLAPLEKPLFVATLLDDPVEYFAHEKGHGILEHIASDSVQRIFRVQVAGDEKFGFR